MTIPVYDIDTLPFISYPIKLKKGKSKKFLGGQAITGSTIISLTLLSKNDTQQKAFYDFWETECNSGTEPFLISFPLFGNTFDVYHPDLLVRFKSDYIADKENCSKWRQTIELELIGSIVYIVDNDGQFIVSDQGEFMIGDDGNYIPTGQPINSYKEIFYAI